MRRAIEFEQRRCSSRELDVGVTSWSRDRSDSETQPKKGRIKPLSTRSMESAKVSAGKVKPKKLADFSATPKSFAIGASCAVAIKPPAAVITNMTYMSQNSGVLAMSSSVC
jgi:hypothetical protein